MSENSKIEWTDHTFNPWWGCMKVSEGCKNCYAETLDNRWKGGHWGPGSDRREMSEPYWAQPLKWNAAAERGGKTARVFCASMADVFEDHAEVVNQRRRLFDLIEHTPALIWQLLTKRPENVLRFVPMRWLDSFPANVWVGTSVENQKAANDRIPHLLKVPASVRFLSCEPLLGPLDLMCPASLWPSGPPMCCSGRDCGCMGMPTEPPLISGIGWVIAGGESGPKARPMHPDWVRSLRDQCAATQTPFFFKQWGEWYPFYDRDTDDPDWKNIPRESSRTRRLNIEGGCGFHGEHVVYLDKRGKGASGRLLDGVEHNEFPSIGITQ